MKKDELRDVILNDSEKFRPKIIFSDRELNSGSGFRQRDLQLYGEKMDHLRDKNKQLDIKVKLLEFYATKYPEIPSEHFKKIENGWGNPNVK